MHLPPGAPQFLKGEFLKAQLSIDTRVLKAQLFIDTRIHDFVTSSTLLTTPETPALPAAMPSVRL
jgi:hypothetical protein